MRCAYVYSPPLNCEHRDPGHATEALDVMRCAAAAQVETIYLGDRKISIRTSVLEEKATACNMLCCYADELKDGFYPWVEQARGRT